MTATSVQRRGSAVKRKGVSEGEFATFDSSDGDEAEIEGLEEELEDLDMSEEAIYHPQAFERIRKDPIGGMDIFAELFSSDL